MNERENNCRDNKRANNRNKNVEFANENCFENNDCRGNRNEKECRDKK